MVSHFLKVIIFVWFFRSTFSTCLTILCTPVPIVFFSSLLTWVSHSHSIKIKQTIRGPIRRNIVCSCSPSCFSLYNNNPPYLCFPFVGRWYAYRRSHIKCGSYFFMITTRVFNIQTFSATNKVCSLVSIKVRPLYITFHGFLIHKLGFCILSPPVGSTSFVELFMIDALSWGSWDDI